MPSVFLLVLTYLGFVSLGLPDTINGVVWPSVARHFGLPLGYLGAVLVASLAGYLVSSLSAGTAMQRLGVGGLLVGSCLLVVVSLAGFGLAPAFGWFVASAVVAGLGAGAIDAGLNAYAAHQFSARHMAWLHGCWGIGATLGAMAAASVLAAGKPWQATYGVLGVAITLLTATFAWNRHAWDLAPGEAAEAPRPAGTMAEALRHPLVWAQMLAFFCYCGVEATVGNWGFTLLTQYRSVPVAQAGTAITCYWGALTAGRFLLGAFADRLGIYRLLGASMAFTTAAGLTFTLAPGPGLAMAGLALQGFALAPLYPGLMTQTPLRLGHLANQAVGFQAGAAMLGAVSVPALGGLVLDRFGLAHLNGLLAILVVALALVVSGLVASAGTRGPAG